MKKERVTVTARDVGVLDASDLLVTPRIVEAVGTAVAPCDVPGLSEALEAVQVAAIEQAVAEGISLSDGPELLKRKAAAREALHDAWARGQEAVVELFDQYARATDTRAE